MLWSCVYIVLVTGDTVDQVPVGDGTAGRDFRHQITKE